MRRTWLAILGWLTACSSSPARSRTDAHAAEVQVDAADPTISDVRAVVPGPGLPADVSPLNSNNNLDVTKAQDGTVLLAFRTAPDHFAGKDTLLHVIGSHDEQTWAHEATFQDGTDLREPRLITHKGRTFLYYAVLGIDSASFDPAGAMVSERLGPGKWTEAKPFYEPTFIPWRIHSVGEVAYMTGYTGGVHVFETGGEPVLVHWLKSTDGEHWQPVVPGQPIVRTGGVSETDAAILDDGSVIAVGRDEAGDDLGFGSVVCKAGPDTLGTWQCVHDPKKYDSPLLFRHAGAVWLIGRRNLTETGNFDLQLTDKSKADQYVINQGNYAVHPKRCALWKVDPVALRVDFVLDLPSRGDTCFASVLPLDARKYALWNYSSPLEGEDVPWVIGQAGPTRIYRMVLDFGAP